MARVVLAWAALCLCLPAVARAQSADSGATSLGDSPYVIKVTPTLAYLDVGGDDVVQGRNFVVVRESEGMYMPVARVRVLRVADSFCIAEILDVAAGESVEVLQRAVPVDLWEQVAAELDARQRLAGTSARGGSRPGTRLITLFGGVDAGKKVDLSYTGTRLTGVGKISGGAVGLRLARTFSRRWRTALTYRLSGEPLAAAADVTQLSAELDLHLLLHGVGRSGPYLGLGGGMHQLSWESPSNVDDTAYKVSVHGVAGLDVRLGGSWGLVVEGGYQKVKTWSRIVDASHARIYAGLSRSF